MGRGAQYPTSTTLWHCTANPLYCHRTAVAMPAPLLVANSLLPPLDSNPMNPNGLLECESRSEERVELVRAERVVAGEELVLLGRMAVVNASDNVLVAL